MTNARYALRLAAMSGLVLFSITVHPVPFQVGDSVTCHLSLDGPALSYEFTPVVGGTLRVDLEPILCMPAAAFPQQNPVLAQLVVFRGDPNVAPRPVAAGRLEPEEAPLPLYFPAIPGVPHRLVLSLGEAAQQIVFQLTLRGLNMRGSTFLVRDENDTRLLTAATRSELAVWVPSATQTLSATFSPDGNRLLLKEGSSVSLIDTFTGQWLGSLTLPPGSDAEFQFIPEADACLPASVTEASTLSLLSTLDLSEIASFLGTHAALSPRGDRFIVYGATEAVIADARSGAVLGQWPGGGSKTEALFSPDGRTVAFWDAGSAGVQSGRLYETSTGQPLGAAFEFASLDMVLFSPDGSRVLWMGISPAGEERAALLQSTSDGSLVPAGGLTLFTRGAPLQAHFGPMSRRLLLAPTGEPEIPWTSLYDCRSGVLLRSYIGFGPVSAVRFHPFGKTLLVVGTGEDVEEREIKFFDAEQGSQLQQYNPQAFQYGEYDPTGRRLALVTQQTSQSTEWEEIQLLDGLQGSAISSANADDWLDPLFSPDGERLVAHSLGANWPDPITQSIIWETGEGSQISSLRPRNGEVQARGVSADSTRYFFLLRLNSGLQTLLLMNLTSGRQVGSGLSLNAAADPVLNLSGLYYVGKDSGNSVGHIGRVRLSDGQVQRGDALVYATPGKLCWSGDGKRLLFDYVTEAGERRAALIDARSLALLGDYSADGGAEFDSTVRPRFLSFDFNGDGRVDALDLFEIQRRGDPEYPEVLHDFIRASDWR